MSTTSLTWRDTSDEGIEAASRRPALKGFTGAHYAIELDNCVRPGHQAVPAAYVLTFDLELDGRCTDEVQLGRHPDLTTAKAVAEHYEHHGQVPAGAYDFMVREFNRHARFLPQSPDGGSATSRPCIEIGGAQVHAWLDENGILRIAANYATVHPALIVDECLPTLITVNGDAVYQG